MDEMFDSCSSLVYLDISNFNTSQVNNTFCMFTFNPLKYINLYNAQIDNDIISQIEDRIDDSAIVCQDKAILSKGKNDCYIFTQSDIYIIVKYGNETTYEADEFTIIDSRKQIQYIKYKNNIIDPTTKFTIEANTTIEIYFSQPITSLYSFFDYYKDGKLGNITYIDLSHLDSSSLKDTQYMFSGCSSLEEIIFNNFDTSQVTNMTGMFQGLSNLKSLDLSNLDTSNVSGMNELFYKCSSLEYLDISNFNTSQVTDCLKMFDEATSLKYINLYNATIIDEIKSKIKEIRFYNNMPKR